MSLEGIIINEFAHATDDIFKEQREIADKRIYNVKWRKNAKHRTFFLRDTLASPQKTISFSGSSGQVVLRYPIYIRFLDITKKWDLKIYNKVLWRKMYKEAFKNIRANYTRFVYDTMYRQLKGENN